MIGTILAGFQGLRTELTRFRKAATLDQTMRFYVYLIIACFVLGAPAKAIGQTSYGEVNVHGATLVGDLFEDPAVQANEYVVEVDHPRYGPQPYINHPVTFTETPGRIRGVAPELGQHSGAVLKEWLAYDDERIAQLAIDGVVG